MTSSHASSALFRAFYVRLFAYALSLTQDMERAQEVVAATCDAALAAGGQINSVEIFVVARRFLADYLTGARAPAAGGDGLASPDPALAALLDGFGQLPPPEREALSLRFDARFSYWEIAQITGENELSIGLRVLQSVQYLRHAVYGAAASL